MQIIIIKVTNKFYIDSHNLIYNWLRNSAFNPTNSDPIKAINIFKALTTKIIFIKKFISFTL